MNQIVSFDEDSASVPAHLLGAFSTDTNKDLSGGISAGYPVLSIKGKTWALAEGGQRSVLMRPGTDDEPTSAIEVIIVKANPNPSKVYYDHGYVEGSDEKPKCYSHDGVAPARDAAEPQCGTCTACPHNAWGSRISDNGSKGKACADSRRIAVVPVGSLDHPMLLRVPAATLRDLSTYAENLSRRNAAYQAVVTKISFDPTVAHPKLVFKALRWLSAEEAKNIAALMAKDIVAQITGADVASVVRLGPEPAAVTSSAPAATPVPVKEKAPAKEKVAKTKPLGAARFGGGDAVVPSSKPVSATTATPVSKTAASRIDETNAELDAALAALDD